MLDVGGHLPDQGRETQQHHLVVSTRLGDYTGAVTDLHCMATTNWHDDRPAESRVPLQIGSLYTTDGASTSGVEVEIERGPESRPEPPDQVDLAGQ